MFEAVQLELEAKREQEQQQQQEDLRTDINITMGFPPLKIGDRFEDYDAFINDVIADICREYQGCTTAWGSGYWIPDDLMDDSYDPSVQIHKEESHTINVSVYKHLEEEAMELIKKSIEFHKEVWDINITDIHVTTQEVKARHFQV